MTTTELATRPAAMTQDQIDLLTRTICRDASRDELALFIHACNRSGLDPFMKQIHAVKRWDDKAKRQVMAIQTGIDGYRLIADRSGRYAGNDDPVFTGEAADGIPAQATVTVYKLVGGIRCPFAATARWSEYYPGDKGGFMWKRMPHVMLGKVAEALALRKAFPAELSGLYTREEMDQAGEVIEAGTTQADSDADYARARAAERPAPVKEMPRLPPVAGTPEANEGCSDEPEPAGAADALESNIDFAAALNNAFMSQGFCEADEQAATAGLLKFYKVADTSALPLEQRHEAIARVASGSLNKFKGRTGGRATAAEPAGSVA